MAWGMALSALFQTLVWALRVGTGGPVHGNAVAAAAATLLAVMLGAALIDFDDHLRLRRADVVSDVALVAALFGGLAYLAMGGPAVHTAVRERAGLSALLAVTAVLVLAAWCVLVLWVASRVHYGLAVCAWALGLGALWLDWDRAHGVAVAVRPEGVEVAGGPVELGQPSGGFAATGERDAQQHAGSPRLDPRAVVDPPEHVDGLPGWCVPDAGRGLDSRHGGGPAPDRPVARCGRRAGRDPVVHESGCHQQGHDGAGARAGGAGGCPGIRTSGRRRGGCLRVAPQTAVRCGRRRGRGARRGRPNHPRERRVLPHDAALQRPGTRPSVEGRCRTGPGHRPRRRHADDRPPRDRPGRAHR